jgi:thiol-disulfide isomerase/thioredoxin
MSKCMKSVVIGGLLLVGWTFVCAGADKSPNVPTIGEKYPGLASSALTYARVAALPDGVLLKAGELTISEKDITSRIAQAPQAQQDQLRKNAFYVLENVATGKLLVQAAKTSVPNADPNAKEQDLIQRHLQGIVAKATVTDQEVADFYQANKEACGGATLDQMKDQLKQLVLQQKQQELADEHVRTLGQRVPIEVSEIWVKAQAALAKDNPVDKARSSGKPSLVDFGSTGCVPCDMLAPILETLKTKYAGKANVVFVHVGQEQILASRYGIRSIPMQFFYDKDGKEVFRHVGFWPQNEIEKKLAEMGVK